MAFALLRRVTYTFTLFPRRHPSAPAMQILLRDFRSRSIPSIRFAPTFFLLVLLVTLPILTGCSGAPLSQKRWGGSEYGQGTLQRQAERAVFFDPYPMNDIGPEVVGGRPREFANPLPEANRNALPRPSIERRYPSPFFPPYSPYPQ